MPWPYRVLAIDPYHRGVGYAILEAPRHLFTFGRIWNTPGRQDTFTRFRHFLLLTRPDAIILEHAATLGSRRCARVVKLLQMIEAEAKRRKVTVHKISRLQTLDRFKEALPRTTKYTVARELARRHPRLLPFLPPPRKPWQSEDLRLAIFDALAFGTAKLRSRRRGVQSP
jgi:hypothetical protein